LIWLSNSNFNLIFIESNSVHKYLNTYGTEIKSMYLWVLHVPHITLSLFDGTTVVFGTAIGDKIEPHFLQT